MFYGQRHKTEKYLIWIKQFIGRKSWYFSLSSTSTMAKSWKLLVENWKPLGNLRKSFLFLSRNIAGVIVASFFFATLKFIIYYQARSFFFIDIIFDNRGLLKHHRGLILPLSCHNVWLEFHFYAFINVDNEAMHASMYPVDGKFSCVALGVDRDHFSSSPFEHNGDKWCVFSDF